MNQFKRLELLIGKEKLRILNNSKVAIFGLGGVGSYVVEALSRSGVGSFILVDNDTVDITNLNRQIIATFDTIGYDKVLVSKNRILSINKSAKITCYKEFFGRASNIDLSGCNYVIDAIDTVTSKLYLIEKCKKLNIPIISCMGTGNKLDPSKLVISDIYNTSVCPLCRVMRHELRKRKIDSLKVVYSTEPPLKPEFVLNNKNRQTPGSTAFVPSVAGLFIAGEIIKSLIK